MGAHIGYFNLMAAKYAGHVFAFETRPSTFVLLQRNIQLPPQLEARIMARAIGLSNHAGHLHLHRPLAHHGAASLRPVDVPNTVIDNIGVDTLDRVLVHNPIAFLKIDVEGGEYDVLLGANQVIKRDCPVIFL